MIKLLSIRNLLLIDEIDLSLDKGLCVLTGETGAGKSMILESLNLITGERAKSGLRPENGKVLSVSALVDVGRFIFVKSKLDELGINYEDEILVKRIISEDGRSKCFINENLVTKENKSLIARVGKDKECIVEDYTASKHGGLGNIYYSDGVKGKVIYLNIKKRTGNQGSLPQSIRTALSDNLKIGYKNHIALAGVFRVLNGKIRSHVQPDYKDIKHEYYDPQLMKCTKDFLQFYEPVGPKLQCYTVLWTGDPTGGELNLRESGEHTHFHSYEHKNDAGHYHFDVSPDEIEYEGYFNIAQEVHRVNNIYKELKNIK